MSKKNKTDGKTPNKDLEPTPQELNELLHPSHEQENKVFGSKALGTVLNPVGALTNHLDHSGDKIRESGNNTGAVLTKAGSGALKIANGALGGAINGLNPVSAVQGATGTVANMVTDHLNDPNRVIDHLSKDGYGPVPKLQKDFFNWSRENSSAFSTSNNFLTNSFIAGMKAGSPNVQPENAGLMLGKMLVNAAAGATVVPNQPINGFAHFEHVGGNMAEFNADKALADKNHSHVSLPGYTAAKEHDKKYPKQAPLLDATFNTELKTPKGDADGVLKKLKQSHKISQAEPSTDNKDELAANIRDEFSKKGIAQRGQDLPDHHNPGNGPSVGGGSAQSGRDLTT